MEHLKQLKKITHTISKTASDFFLFVKKLFFKVVPNTKIKKHQFRRVSRIDSVGRNVEAS